MLTTFRLPTTKLPAAKEFDLLAAELRGEMIRPGDAGYDEPRGFCNGTLDTCPAVIARCADLDDVRIALHFARFHHLPVAARGGGHGVAGLLGFGGGVVIDLSPLRGIAIDPVARTARVGAGVCLDALAAAARDYGLAIDRLLAV